MSSSLANRTGRRSLGPTSKSNTERIVPQPSKIPKRANSMAASEFAKRSAAMAETTRAAAIDAIRERENMTQPLPTTSRRNAPGPRKSTLRTRPPQIFQSPTGMMRSPSAPKAKAGFAEAADTSATGDDTPSKKRKATVEAAQPRKSFLAPSANITEAHTIAITQEARRRRVTFSNRQERTDFIRDEPTMHMRGPIETEPAHTTISTVSSSSGRGSLAPSAVEDNGSENSSEESSSEEEDDSGMDMEMATVSGIVPPRSNADPDDQTMDLTAAIGSIAEHGDESAGSPDLSLLRSRPAKGRRSSGAASARSNNSISMDLTAISGAGDESDLMQGEQSAMDMTVAMGTQMPAKNKLKARDSLASHRAIGRPSLSRPPRGRVSVASAADNDSTVDMDMTDASRSAMEMTQVLGRISEGDDADDMDMDETGVQRDSHSLVVQRKTPSPVVSRARSSAPIPDLPFASSPTKSPATPSRFRRSMLGGMTDSPKSPARRIQVPIDPAVAHINPFTVPPFASTLTPLKEKSAATLPNSARKSSPERPKEPLALRMRKSFGGALPSAHSLKPGKTPVALKPSVNGEKTRSSIVAAVLPNPQAPDSFSADDFEESNEDAEGEEKGSHSFHSATEAPPTDDSDEAGMPPPRNLTLSEFFSLSGMNFHDDTRPVKVRVVPPRDGKRPQEGALKNSLQFKAMAGSVPMLETLVDACRDLKHSVAEGSSVLKDIEDKFVHSPPDLVRELLSLNSEAEKKEMESQFKLQKQAARAIAKEGYLGWCLDNQYGEEVVASLQATKAILEADLAKLNADSIRMRQEILPALRDRRNALRDQVERIRERQLEIEQCPVEDLEGLHDGMAELLPELQSRRSIHREKTESLERMRAKLEENLTKKAELEESIEQCRKVCEQIQGYTRGEAARLAAEIREVEKLHMWKLQSASLTKLHLTHDWALDLVVLLGPDGAADSVDLSLTPNARGDSFNEEFVAALQEDITSRAVDSGEAWQVPKLIRHITASWTSARRLQYELSRLSLSYPYEVLPLAQQQLEGSPRHILIQTSMLLPKQRTKIHLRLRLDLEALIYGDSTTLFDLDNVKAEVVYGQVDGEAMAAQIVDHLAAEDFVLGNGTLALACREAVETFAG